MELVRDANLAEFVSVNSGDLAPARVGSEALRRSLQILQHRFRPTWSQRNPMNSLGMPSRMSATSRKSAAAEADSGKPPALFGYRKFWAHRLTPAPFLPMSREEMDELGWDSCDVILVTGDAYVDHPSFGMAIVGRTLEAQGFRVGIIAQPDWTSTDDFCALGPPNLYFGITGGNMDSMVNRYTSDRRVRRDDAYTPDGAGGKRPDRCVTIYAERVREAYSDVPVVIGGIEASLRRIAHFDYWANKIHRSVLVDAKADILLFGNAERALVELTHRLSRGEPISSIQDLRGTVFRRKASPAGWFEVDSTTVDVPGRIDPRPDPYAMSPNATADSAKRSGEGDVASLTSGEQTTAPESPTDATPAASSNSGVVHVVFTPRHVPSEKRAESVIRLPSFEAVKRDAVLYAHASRVLHLESNPGNARALVQRHGQYDIWLNPPPIPLETNELDAIYELPYARTPHPAYGDARIPAYEMIRFSVAIQRGCFGGCTFCSITEHEGRVIQSRSEASVLREVEDIRDRVPGFTGVISDLGGPTANMYRLRCKSQAVEAACRRPSCVFPGVCPNLDTNHTPLIALYRKARTLPGIKKVLVASGVRYDLAIESPEYVKELAQHHTGGYLKIAPEALSDGPLSKMMKPGMGTYYRFKALFDKFSEQAGKEQYLIPYFIAAHPGTTDEDMLELAIWLKKNSFRTDQVQAFLPSPMATATAMYHSGKNPLGKVSHGSEAVHIPRGAKIRRLHKAFLRYHDPNNWPILRDALNKMGRADLIGNGKHHLVPRFQPAGTGGRTGYKATPTPSKITKFRTQHTRVEGADTTTERSSKRSTKPGSRAPTRPGPATPKVRTTPKAPRSNRPNRQRPTKR